MEMCKKYKYLYFLQKYFDHIYKIKIKYKYLYFILKNILTSYTKTENSRKNCYIELIHR